MQANGLFKSLLPGHAGRLVIRMRSPFRIECPRRFDAGRLGRTIVHGTRLLRCGEDRRVRSDAPTQKAASMTKTTPSY